MSESVSRWGFEIKFLCECVDGKERKGERWKEVYAGMIWVGYAIDL